jgi:hypothetical protein
MAPVYFGCRRLTPVTIQTALAGNRKTKTARPTHGPLAAMIIATEVAATPKPTDNKVGLLGKARGRMAMTATNDSKTSNSSPLGSTIGGFQLQ